MGDTQAHKLSYLCDGNSKEIPPIDLFINNKVQTDKKPELSVTQIE